MAGHSHSANIAVRKGKQDAARAKLFSKLSRYIIIAARAGGGDPETNLKLRYAIDKARAVSMPRDNIERAIKRGTGELEGSQMEELVYEGFAPGGSVAVICDILTGSLLPTISQEVLTCLAEGKPVTKVHVGVDAKGQFTYKID